MSKDTETTIETTPVVLRDPTKLRLAPANKRIIRLKQGTPRFNALVEDIKEEGILDALLIDAEGYVYDGWTRREIAVDLQMPKVPCKVCVTPENARDVVWRYTLKRKNLTLGQLAYCLAPDLEPVFQEMQARRARNAAKTKTTELSSISSKDELAAKYGISYELLRQARKLHETWDENPDPKKYGDAKKPITLQALLEPQIMDMDEPLSLGGALKAIGYYLVVEKDASNATGGKPKGDVVKQMNLFTEVVEEGITRYDYYAKWSEKLQEKHWQDVRVKAAALKPEKAAGLAEYYRKLAEEYELVVKNATKGKK